MKYSKDLDFFLDKACSIFIREINWRYTLEASAAYFTGIVYRIDTMHLWMRNPVSKSVTCISLESIQGISEEQVLIESNPDHKKIIDQYRTEKPDIAAQTTISGDKPKFINIKEMSELAKKH